MNLVETKGLCKQYRNLWIFGSEWCRKVHDVENDFGTGTPEQRTNHGFWKANERKQSLDAAAANWLFD